MRLKIIVPEVNPDQYEKPKKCPHAGCKGVRFHLKQEVDKNVRDTKHTLVKARRYECLLCHGTFRVYPQGIRNKSISQRLAGVSVMMYLLGMSYGAVEIMTKALGFSVGKSSVYRAVQAAAEKVPGLKQKKLVEGYRTKAVGADITSVRCNGKWLTLGISVDATNGVALTIDKLSGEDAETLKEWLKPIVDAVDADILVTDDADALKKAADDIGLAQQVCKSHVGKNTDQLVDELSTLIQNGKDISLQSIGIPQEQALADLAKLKELIHSRQPDEQVELERLAELYANACKPRKGSFTIAYRMRNLLLDRWNLWPRLTFYRTWKDEHGNEILDGTNNACERCIGWSIKERYRTMRGYKREQSALNVSRLIASANNHRSRGLKLSSLIA
jgi:transposase-like protein